MTLKNNRKWNIKHRVDDINNILSLILKDRGINDIDRFLNPRIEDIPSYKKLYNVKKAVKEIVHSISNDEKIYIHGDFDVDGISASAILWQFIYQDLAKHINKKIDILPYIPDRVDEGYGLSRSSLDNMISNGAQLIITVDCGVRDRELIEEYIENNNLNIIITDHHQPPDDISDVKYTIVHQMFPNKEFVEQKICGSAVIYFLIQALIEEYKMNENKLYGIDLVGLATVTDMMPLVGLNRIFVKYAIEEIKKGNRLGLKKLINISGVNEKEFDSYHMGFIVGPRINAAGRIGSAMEALRLLASNNNILTNELSSKLNNLNVLRQENTKEILDKALEQYENQKNNKIFIAIGDNWHEGIIGLVAGKIFEKINKPTIVITRSKKGELKGSARSISSFNITQALDKNKKYLDKYGGHAQAAGFTLSENNLDQFIPSLVKYANKKITDDMLIKELVIDIELDIKDINIDTYNILEKLKPFGYGNNRPLIAIHNVRVLDKYIMKGNQHMKLKVGSNEYSISAVMFNCDEDINIINVGDNISISGYIDINKWNNNTYIQLQVKEYSV